MERQVAFDGAHGGVVCLNAPLLRYPGNPILAPGQVNEVWQEPHRRVVTVHNAGVNVVGGETVMLFRSHLRSGISVIGAARSDDGVSAWRVAPRPALTPARPADRYGPGIDPAMMIEIESGGVEDPRINVVEGTFAVTYSAYHARQRNRVRVCLAVTDDFATFTRLGPVLDDDMRNVVIFGERIGGRYVGLFRPNDALPGDTGGIFREVRIGYSDDFRAGPWIIEDAPVMISRAGPGAFSDKIGPGAPPLRTDRGWLHLFHGVRTTMDGNPYVLGVALHDLEHPRRVRVSSIPVLFPSRADCRVAESDYVHVPSVVFSCGMVRRPNGELLIYYGGNDTVMNLAISHEDVLIELCHRYGQDPMDGTLSYDL